MADSRVYLADWSKQSKALIEKIRASERLTAEDYAVRVNVTSDTTLPGEQRRG